MAFSTVKLTPKQTAQFRQLAFEDTRCGYAPLAFDRKLGRLNRERLRKRMKDATEFQRYARMGAIKSWYE